jgi:hypothetical protein
MQAAGAQVFGEAGQPRHRLDDAFGDKGARTVALGQQAFLDQAGDRLAHGHARQLQRLRQIPFARQRLARLDIAMLDHIADSPAQAQVGQRLVGGRIAADSAVFVGQGVSIEAQDTNTKPLPTTSTTAESRTTA